MFDLINERNRCMFYLAVFCLLLQSSSLSRERNYDAMPAHGHAVHYELVNVIVALKNVNSSLYCSNSDSARFWHSLEAVYSMCLVQLITHDL